MTELDLVSIDNNIATLTIENPPLNILTNELMQRIYKAVDKLALDTSVRIVIFRGAEDRAFSAGSDLREFPLDATGLKGAEQMAFEQRVYRAIQELPQVTIAALNGLTLGGGGELALSCDLRVASNKSQIGFPEINVGAFPGASGTQRLLRLVGPSQTKKLTFFGDLVSAHEALAIGLVDHVAPDDEFWSTVDSWSNRLAEKSWTALQAIKICVNRGIDLGFDGGLKVELEQIARVFKGEDIEEGLQAFIEKRKPRFNRS